MPGPVALVGSGEYLPVMAEIEAGLLAGRPPRYVQLPTAASAEGDDVLDYWIDLGRTQAERLGVAPVPLRVVDRATADDPGLAASVAGAGLIYLSGGNPGLLAGILEGSRVWGAIVEAWRGGAALAGCSAGAMALAEWLLPWRGGEATPMLGLVPQLAVIPHFDMFVRRGIADGGLARTAPEGVTVVGIDEETALVNESGDLRLWRVAGRQGVAVLTGEPVRLHPGDIWER